MHMSGKIRSPFLDIEHDQFGITPHSGFENLPGLYVNGITISGLSSISVSMVISRSFDIGNPEATSGLKVVT